MRGVLDDKRTGAVELERESACADRDNALTTSAQPTPGGVPVPQALMIRQAGAANGVLAESPGPLKPCCQPSCFGCPGDKVLCLAMTVPDKEQERWLSVSACAVEGLDLEAVSRKDHAADANGSRGVEGFERHTFTYELVLVGGVHRPLRSKHAGDELGCNRRALGMP